MLLQKIATIEIEFLDLKAWLPCHILWTQWYLADWTNNKKTKEKNMCIFVLLTDGIGEDYCKTITSRHRGSASENKHSAETLS